MRRFAERSLLAIANDGADSFTVPWQLGDAGRIKLQSVGNIFFDVNDEDLTVLTFGLRSERAGDGDGT